MTSKNRTTRSTRKNQQITFNIEESLQKIKEQQNEQEEINKRHESSLENVMKELQSIQKEQNGTKRKRNGSVSSIQPPNKQMNGNVPAVDINIPNTQNPASAKSFTLKHVFNLNVPEMRTNGTLYSKTTEHFGVSWGIIISRNKDDFEVFLGCRQINPTQKWSIKVEFECKLIGVNGRSHIAIGTFNFENPGSDGWGFRKLKKWDEIVNEYLIDNSLSIDGHVRIKKMEGVYKDDFRSFDDEIAKECSDIILIVDNRKFYVAKLYLAAHSSYFKAMFLGMFGESSKSEITLTGIDAVDFQNYLEVLYGEPAIDEYTVEGILLVADMYDTQIVIRKCEKFLLGKSRKMLKKKLDLSVRYDLDNLKKFCLSKIRTVGDIRSVIQGDIRDLEPSLMAALLEKSISFQ